MRRSIISADEPFTERCAELLAPLLADFRELDGWPACPVTPALMLYDVLAALGLDEDAMQRLLGAAAWIHVCRVLDERFLADGEE